MEPRLTNAPATELEILNLLIEQDMAAVKEASAELDKHLAQRAKLLRELRLQCEHRNVISVFGKDRCSGSESDFCYTRRLCLDCRAEEAGRPDFTILRWPSHYVKPRDFLAKRYMADSSELRRCRECLTVYPALELANPTICSECIQRPAG